MIIDEILKLINLKKIYFCSGARNAPLIKDLNSFDLSFHFDERVSSFVALGESKLSNRPVGICTTSGTAVSECYSAMIEAYYSRIPLVMISADRPVRLRNSDAPQAIDQMNIFGKYARSFLNIDQNTTLDDIDFKSLDYPMHINIEVEHAKTKIDSYPVESLSLKQLENLIDKAKNPLIIISEDHKLNQEDAAKIIEHYNTYIETTARLELNGNYLFDKELLTDQSSFDLFIKIGRTPISKIWRNLDHLIDPSIPVVAINSFKTGIGRGFYYLGDLPLMNKKIENKSLVDSLSSLLLKYPESEAALIQRLILSKSKNDIMYVGNSMPIRYIEMLKSYKVTNIYASRGANGIDGQISTAIGMAMATEHNVHVLIGDLTALYDLNALLFPNFPKNLKISIINNFGGRIFERVCVDSKVINEHALKIEKIFEPLHAHIKFLYPDNSQTRLFWDEWEKI